MSNTIADTLYVNGSVIPMTGERIRAEAAAVSGERILAVGGREELERLSEKKRGVSI